MKKTILVAAIGFLVLQTVNASAETRKSVSLHYQQTATSFGSKMLGMKLTNLFVEYDGVVHRSDCPVGLEIPCQTSVVAKLTAYKMDEIKNLIDEATAQKNKLVRSHTSARCIAPASKEANVTADNDSLPLYKGDICSAIFESNTEAGKKLTTLAAELVKKTTKN